MLFQLLFPTTHQVNQVIELLGRGVHIRHAFLRLFKLLTQFKNIFECGFHFIVKGLAGKLDSILRQVPGCYMALFIDLPCIDLNFIHQHPDKGGFT